MNITREPALIVAFVVSLVMTVCAFVFPLTVDQQGILNAVAVAVAGVVTALMVKSDQLAPAILGLVKAVLALGLAFGLGLSTANQAVIMTAAAALVAAFVRTQVTAPVPVQVVP